MNEQMLAELRAVREELRLMREHFDAAISAWVERRRLEEHERWLRLVEEKTGLRRRRTS